MAAPKLFMLMLGATPPGRYTEQHDIFFGIAHSLKELVPDLLRFWPEDAKGLHVDAWRQVTMVDGHRIDVVAASDEGVAERKDQLFFINLGGYQKGLFDERHFKILTVQQDKGMAVKHAMRTPFYKEVRFSGAGSHIDDHYALDVDNLYNVSDILPASHKAKYTLRITKDETAAEDDIHLGYFRLNKLP